MPVQPMGTSRRLTIFMLTVSSMLMIFAAAAVASGSVKSPVSQPVKVQVKKTDTLAIGFFVHSNGDIALLTDERLDIYRKGKRTRSITLSNSGEPHAYIDVSADAKRYYMTDNTQVMSCPASAKSCNGNLETYRDFKTEEGKPYVLGSDLNRSPVLFMHHPDQENTLTSIRLPEGKPAAGWFDLQADVDLKLFFSFDFPGKVTWRKEGESYTFTLTQGGIYPVLRGKSGEMYFYLRRQNDQGDRMEYAIVKVQKGSITGVAALDMDRNSMLFSPRHVPIKIGLDGKVYGLQEKGAYYQVIEIPMKKNIPAYLKLEK